VIRNACHGITTYAGRYSVVTVLTVVIAFRQPLLVLDECGLLCVQWNEVHISVRITGILDFVHSPESRSALSKRPNRVGISFSSHEDAKQFQFSKRCVF
jgi:hypothetical protein